jgi:thymidylate synthase
VYKPITQESKLLIGKGNVAVVTGWTPSKQVQRALDISDYAVIGNLYNAERGLSFLIRNLLANPFVHTLVLITATKEDKNAGSNQCLADFFLYGYHKGVSTLGKKCWIINSSITGYIDIEIPEFALNLLRNSISYIQNTSVASAIPVIKECNKKQLTPYSKPLFFAIEEYKAKRLEGDIFGQKVQGQTIAETWVKILQRIRINGIIRPFDGGQWQELIDLISVVTDEPEEFYFPEPNYLPINKDFLANYKSQIMEDAPYKGGVKYTYGQRLRSWFGNDQIKEVIKKLIKEIDSASAVMNLWDSGSGNQFWQQEGDDADCENAIARFGRDLGDSDHNHSGSPCLNHISVRVIENKLTLTATFRSNDMYSAWVANAMGLRELQKHIRDEVNKISNHNLKLGNLITISQSAHIYDDTWDTVDLLIKKEQILTYCDCVGNFLIEYTDKIIVTQLQSGEVARIYEGTNPLSLIRKISLENPSIELNHIGYLGIELAKAQLKKQEYKQDQNV